MCALCVGGRWGVGVGEHVRGTMYVCHLVTYFVTARYVTSQKLIMVAKASRQARPSSSSFSTWVITSPTSQWQTALRAE